MTGNMFPPSEKSVGLLGILPRRTAGCEEGPLALLGGLSLFWAVVTALPLLAGSASITLSRPLAIGFIIFAALAGWRYQRILGGGAWTGSSSPGAFARGFFYLTVVLYLLLWVLAYALPDFSYDGNYYHSPTIHFWLNQGSVHWIETGSSSHWGPVGAFAWNGYPKGVEVVQSIFLLATGCSRLLNSVNLLFLPLGGLAVTGIALTLGAPSGPALVAGCLFFFLPVNLAQSLTGMVDTASAACYLAFFALLLGVAKRIGCGRVPWRWLAGLGASLGLAAGSKWPGLFLIPAGGVILVVRLYLARRKVRREAANRPVPPLSFSRGGAFIALTLLIGLLLGGYWAGRNWIRTGNPLYPVEVTVGGRQLFVGVDLATQFRPPYREGTEEWSQAKRVLANWLACSRLSDPEVLVYDSRVGGLGFAWLVSIPAVLWLFYLCLRAFLGKMFSRSSKGHCQEQSDEAISPHSTMASDGQYIDGVAPPGIAKTLRHNRDKLLEQQNSGNIGGSFFLPDLLFLCLLMFFALPRHHSHMARYTIWLAGLGLPCLAVVTGRISAPAGEKRWWRWLGPAWLGAVCLLASRDALTGLRLHLSFLDTFQGKEVSGCWGSRLARALRSPYPSGYYWSDLNGTVMELIMAGRDPVGVAIAEKNQRHLIFGHLVQGQALGERKIVFIDHFRVESEPDYLPRLIREDKIRYAIWDSTIPLNASLVNGSVRQDYSVGKELWHIFTFAE